MTFPKDRQTDASNCTLNRCPYNQHMLNANDFSGRQPCVLAPTHICNPLHVSFPFPSHSGGKQRLFARKTLRVRDYSTAQVLLQHHVTLGSKEEEGTISLAFMDTAVLRLLVGTASSGHLLPVQSTPARGGFLKMVYAGAGRKKPHEILEHPSSMCLALQCTQRTKEQKRNRTTDNVAHLMQR